MKNKLFSNQERPPRGGARRPGYRPSPGDPRTFSFLGPDRATLDVRMMESLELSDGRHLRTWSFGEGFNGDRSVPGPVIELIEGQTAEITLESMMPHTIHFHGLDVDQANDGVPATSGYVGSAGGGGGMGGGGGGMGSGFGRVEGYASLGNSFTYRFIAPHAGTYAYHCHVDTVLHIEMGMYGAVIVRPPDGRADIAWSGAPSYDREYVWMLHTFDSSWHGEMVSGPVTVRHRPDYFMINGRDGFDIDDPTVALSGSSGERLLIRAINMGYQPAVVYLGGLEFSVIASDGRPLPLPIMTTEYPVAPGERYDILLELPAPGTFPASVEYHDIRMRRILGKAATAIRSI